MTLSRSDFDYVRELVRRESAIVLEPGKEYLVESRLLTLARRENVPSVETLVEKMRQPALEEIRRRAVEALTTGETSFFRDVHPWELLRTSLLPELLQRRATERKLVFWCLACSSGQEPYTLAMVLKEFAALATWSVQIVATDISREALARAASGKYSQLEVNRGLPAALMVKYFVRQGIEWQIQDDLRRLIDFKLVNLAAAWPTMPAPDIVFLRNVLIYFDVTTKKTILGKVRQHLRRDGYLFLGGAETTIGLDDAYERLQFSRAGCYRLRGG